MTNPYQTTRDYTIGDVARLLGVRRYVVNHWFETGRLKGFTVPGDQIRVIPRDSFERFCHDYGFNAIREGTR